MRRIVLFLMLLMTSAAFLSGCGGEELMSSEHRGIWYGALENLKNSKNYTVELTSEDKSGKVIKKSVGYYTGNRSKITQDDETLYFDLANGVCTGYGYDEESEFWINAEEEYNAYYFYAYSLVDRINKFSAYLDQGLLSYDEETGIFSGDNLRGGYLCEEDVHEPVSISVQIRNGRFVSLTETYTIKDDSSNAEDIDDSERPVYTDQIEIRKYSTTEVRLPGNTISEEDLEKFGVIEDKEEG